MSSFTTSAIRVGRLAVERAAREAGFKVEEGAVQVRFVFDRWDAGLLYSRPGGEGGRLSARLITEVSPSDPLAALAQIEATVRDMAKRQM